MCVGLKKADSVVSAGSSCDDKRTAEDDAEPETIMQKVAKASGANYSFHKETNRFRDSGPQGPVVSSHTHTCPQCNRVVSSILDHIHFHLKVWGL